MYHKNADDKHDNVLIKFAVTPEEERVVRNAIKAYRVHSLKNRVIHQSGKKYARDGQSVHTYLEEYPEYFELHGEDKLRIKGASPADILDEYFVERGESTDCERWYNLARCVIAIGEHEALQMGTF